MAKLIRSRHGLSRCTSCRRHVRAEDRPSDAACPFCGAALTERRPLISLPDGRTGLLAASLIAFSSAACGGADSTPLPPGSNQNQASEDPVDDTREPVVENGFDEPADPVEVEAYGMPPEPADPVPEPAYGLVPMPQPDQEVRPQPSPDPGEARPDPDRVDAPVPLYGLPPGDPSGVADPSRLGE